MIGRESVNWGLDRQRKFLENAAEQFVVGLPCRVFCLFGESEASFQRITVARAGCTDFANP